MAIKTYLVRSPAALDSVMHFEKHFTKQYCGHGKRYHFLSKIFEDERITLSNVTALDFRRYLGTLPPFEMKCSQVG